MLLLALEQAVDQQAPRLWSTWRFGPALQLSHQTHHQSLSSCTAESFSVSPQHLQSLKVAIIISIIKRHSMRTGQYCGFLSGEHYLRYYDITSKKDFSYSESSESLKGIVLRNFYKHVSIESKKSIFCPYFGLSARTLPSVES